MELSVEELADAAGVPVRTVRYYVTEGLIPGPGGRGRAAAYGDEHLLRLRLVRRLAEQRVPLAEIRARVAGLTLEDVAELLAEAERRTVQVQAERASPKAYVSALLDRARALNARAPRPPAAASSAGPGMAAASAPPAAPAPVGPPPANPTATPPWAVAPPGSAPPAAPPSAPELDLLTNRAPPPGVAGEPRPPALPARVGPPSATAPDMAPPAAPPPASSSASPAPPSPPPAARFAAASSSSGAAPSPPFPTRRAAHDPDAEQWTRWELAPGVELHVRADAADARRRLVRRLLDAAQSDTTQDHAARPDAPTQEVQ